ncbi:MAG TPA: DUF4058 family protein [Pirellulales bacterium]|jgi:hypothetical protein|nr:DUF4058 family protein [Pirellulales bacterium]
MPLLDHFHPPLHGPRRWEGFHHSWATTIAHQLNEVLPADYFAESEISLGPELEIDVAAMEDTASGGAVISATRRAAPAWTPARQRFAVKADYWRLDAYEVRVFQDLGGAELRAAVELVSPGNKDRAGSRLTFAAKCAGYLKHGVSVVVIDVVTSRAANLHRELFKMLEVKSRHALWQSRSGLYAVAYRPVTLRRSPRIEVWAERLALGKALPVMPLWLTLDVCVPLALEDSYTSTCRSLRIPA